MVRVPVKPGVFRWARERAGLTPEDLEGRFKKVREWESGEMLPTLKQLEEFARAVHLPIGCMFLSEPLEEPVPIPDFRTFDGKTVVRPSPNLLDTVDACLERQDWYRDFVQTEGEPELGFVGSATLNTPRETVAARMRETLDFDLEVRQQCQQLNDALRVLIRQAENVGILVMVSGVVGSNNHRRLDPEEFRGFAISDPYAPLIFVNGADRKAAQIFTLAHELAHIWLGESALSNSDLDPRNEFRSEEIWCNAVAAEFLVPLSELQFNLQKRELLSESLSRLTRIFKVSNLVILRRLRDAEWLTQKRFDIEWKNEIQRLKKLAPTKGASGGNFYRTTLARVSHKFAHDLVLSALAGQTLYRDAFHMLGISKTKTFINLAHEVGALR